MSEQAYLAVDLGASGGRVLAGRFDGRRIRLDELHRFENGPVTVAGRMHWDVLRLWSEICHGLRAAADQLGDQVRSVGVDTWGVDFALLCRDGNLVGNPVHYRDHRTDGILEKAFRQVSRDEIFAHTGLQFMQFNTLYQLLAMRLAKSRLLDVADSLLMMPDLFHWMLTGVKSNEFTNATTTQFYNPEREHWATDLLERFDLPVRILGDIVAPGTRLGKLRADVAADTGLAGVSAVLPGTHDTASAVMAVPARGVAGAKPDWCYISSGTWSLMGVELPAPVINDRCRELNFTNEGGVGNTIRLLKNIGGLWLVQQCRAAWSREGQEYSWEDLNRLSAAAQPLAALVDPDDARFLAPSDMPAAIAEYCRQTGQAPPQAPGEFVRCALESLALRYRQALGWLESLTGGPIRTMHIVGGGTQNKQLCQATADACRRLVIAGPVEATALGNAMMQAVSAGDVVSIAEARDVIRHSCAVEEYEPCDDRDSWDAAFDRFCSLTGAADEVS